MIVYAQMEERNIAVNPMLLENLNEVQLVGEGGLLDDEYEVLANDDAEYIYILILMLHGDNNAKAFIQELRAKVN